MKLYKSRPLYCIIQDKVAVQCANGRVESCHGGLGWINVRAGNAVQRQAFLAVPRQRRWVNSGRASDSRDSTGAEGEGGRPDGLDVHRHRRCNPHYFSRGGAFLRSV